MPPSLPISPRGSCVVASREIAQLLLQHILRQRRKAFTQIEISQRQLGSRAPQESGGHWEVPTGGFQASPGDVNTQEHSLWEEGDELKVCVEGRRQCRDSCRLS